MMNSVSAVLLQAAPQPGGGLGFPLMMLGMVVVMYFFMIRPQAKRAKEQKKFSESIAPGEHIITTAGIHGRIARENEDGSLKLEVSNNSFINIERSAVSMEMTNAYRKKNDPAAVAVKK